MIKNDSCPRCGCREFGEGQITGASMLPINKLFTSLGSNIIAVICTKCGYIIDMKVGKPEKFK